MKRQVFTPFLKQVVSCIFSLYLWYNNYININKKTIYFENFSKQNRNFLSQLYDGSANSKNLTQCKNFPLETGAKYSLRLEIDWKFVIKQNSISDDILVLGYHQILSNCLVNVEQLPLKNVMAF